MTIKEARKLVDVLVEKQKEIVSDRGDLYNLADDLYNLAILDGLMMAQAAINGRPWPL